MVFPENYDSAVSGFVQLSRLLGGNRFVAWLERETCRGVLEREGSCIPDLAVTCPVVFQVSKRLAAERFAAYREL